MKPLKLTQSIMVDTLQLFPRRPHLHLVGHIDLDKNLTLIHPPVLTYLLLKTMREVLPFTAYRSSNDDGAVII